MVARLQKLVLAAAFAERRPSLRLMLRPLLARADPESADLLQVGVPLLLCSFFRSIDLLQVQLVLVLACPFVAAIVVHRCLYTSSVGVAAGTRVVFGNSVQR